MKQQQNGNVLLYILMAVALLAALTYTISQESGGQQQNQLTEARIKLMASNLIKHVTTTEIAMQSLTQWGVDLDQIRFDLPGAAGFTSNTTEQIYHPAGGGLQPFQASSGYFDTNGTTGWAFQGNVNVEWTPTSATDLIMSFINVETTICEQINQQLRGTTAIPASTVNFSNTFTETAPDNNFTVATCAGCENIKSLCITNGTTNAFYTIVGSR